MWLLLKRNARRQFKAKLQGGPRKGKVSERPKDADVQQKLRKTTPPPLPKKNVKSDNEENLDSSYNAVQLEESANSANTLVRIRSNRQL